MRFVRHGVGVLLLGLLAAGLVPAQGQARSDLKKLHILLALDTEDEKLAPSLKIDEERLKDFFAKTIPADRYQLTVLRGTDVTEKRILDHYRTLKVGPDEGLVFFYGGHGAADPIRGHYFDLTPPRKRLLRSDLREAMQKKNAGLVMILSDCCSTMKKLREPKPPQYLVKARSTEIHPVVRELFFRARGTVDVTAATDNASWSDDEEGGIFTRTLVEMILKTRDASELGMDDRGRLDWNSFYPKLRERTLVVFSGWRSDLTRRGERIPARSQKPAAFFLGEQTVYAVVGIQNATKQTLKYKFRWKDFQEFPEEISLGPGEKKVHYVAVGATEGTLPVCEGQFPGIDELRPLKVRRYVGKTVPTYRDGTKYKLMPRD